MFPLKFPFKHLSRASKEDWVLDPFCGRGTTNFAARLLGLNSVGIDSSPDPPDISYQPKADWPFRFRYQGLKYFLGRPRPIGTAGIPILLTILLIIPPFGDRRPERNPIRRPIAMLCGLILAGIITTLTLLGASSKPGMSEVSPPPDTTTAKQAAPSSFQARARLFQSQGCIACHKVHGAEDTSGPDLSAEANRGRSRDWLTAQIQNPKAHNPDSIMPAFTSLSKQDLNSLVGYLLSLGAKGPQNASAASARSAPYVGSTACRTCHSSIYERWRKTRMANVVRDPREHPDAIIPDLPRPDPLVKFSKDDIAFVYGSKWKQRYFKKVGKDFFPFPAQWDVTHQMWRPYFVANGTDWWTRFYPPDNFQRPTGPLCDGCHSVNYDISTKTVTEWNVGCNKCHGPGGEHVKQPGRSSIVNPARLDYVQANNVCIQCHSQGQPLANPIAGKYYDWPVGFHVGLKLSDFWKLEEHKLGETSFTHFADGTAHKNRMQGNDYVTSLMYTRGVACFSCHDVHDTENNATLWKPASVLCLDCHGPNSPNGPHAATIEQHTHHKPGSSGSECIGCHMPKIAQTIADVNIRSHTFHFITPAKTEALKIPNACNVCHADKPTAWATAALKTWTDRSPWRMAE